MVDRDISLDASRAYMYNLQSKNGNKAKNGGYVLKHSPSSYGIALKWLIYLRGYTYSQFGERYNGTTGQNINNMINRISKDRFYYEDIDKMCDILCVTRKYFDKLCEEIEKKMEK